MGAARPRKNSYRILSVLSNFAPIEITDTEPSKFPIPSTLGARPLGFYSSVRNSSNVCSSSKTDCIQCSISSPPFIYEDSVESAQSCSLEIGICPCCEILRVRSCLTRVCNSQESSCIFWLNNVNISSQASEDSVRCSSSC